MKISIAKTAGFCMGVRRAVDMVLDASNMAKEPIFTYGPLIHNPQVLEMLESKKIFRLDTIPETGEGTVLIRAHGVPPEDETALKKAGFNVINATCPRVVRVQVIINKFAQKGYTTIIIGDEKHPEVVGLLGYAKGNGHTITSMEQFCALPEFENAVVVAQTTQNTKFYDQIKRFCASHAPHYKIFDTICGSTEKRQDEVRELAKTHDAVIVVGGKQSGNTKRLAQVARETHTQATHIEDAKEIDYKALVSANSIAITAGASTPNWIIKDTCQKVDHALKHKRPLLGKLTGGLDVLLKTNLLLAAGAAGLTYGAAEIQGGANTLIYAAIAMLYVLSMQIMNNLMTIRSDTYNKPDRAAFYRKYGIYLRALAFVSGGAGLYLAYTQGLVCFGVLSAMSLLGLSYNLNIIPAFFAGSRIQSFKDVPGSKTILIALAWGIVTSLLPAVVEKSQIGAAGLAFGFSTGLAFARTAFVDILAIQGDRIAGKETLPILLGETKSFTVIGACLILTAAMPLAAMFFPRGNMVFWLALVPVFMLLLIRLFREDSFLSGSPYEFLFESSFLLAGVMAAVI
ncbi:MAG: 4-hydroxy-3-methylbut-2-enyl diphosphate reductase [Desulfobacter sp.]|nr:4-hydroxy-3-methylbut-2-enyl diphosphate reductase [Desulfobacter sp.]WDP85233.1 MAG: 4-hydroxy-3-methylbut-2-enyl diphosphate reductase [Desulfobacter sp.]